MINLPAATTRVSPSGQWLVLKNVGSNAVNVTPNGTDTIDGLNAIKALPAVSGTTDPTFWLACDGVSAWYVLASFGTSNSPGLGVWDGTRTVNTVYQAATDGFVLAEIFANADMTHGFISAETDGANPPGTTRAQAWFQRLDSVPVQIMGQTLTFPVRKGDYWEVVTSVTGTVITTVYWIPSGS